MLILLHVCKHVKWSKPTFTLRFFDFTTIALPSMMAVSMADLEAKPNSIALAVILSSLTLVRSLRFCGLMLCAVFLVVILAFLGLFSSLIVFTFAGY